MSSTLPATVPATSDRRHGFDGDAGDRRFAGDALVNDRRELWGKGRDPGRLAREISEER